MVVRLSVTTCSKFEFNYEDVKWWVFPNALVFSTVSMKVGRSLNQHRYETEGFRNNDDNMFDVRVRCYDMKRKWFERVDGSKDMC